VKVDTPILLHSAKKAAAVRLFSFVQFAVVKTPLGSTSTVWGGARRTPGRISAPAIPKRAVAEPLLKDPPQFHHTLLP